MDHITKLLKGKWRYILILLGMLLFLPPLAALSQLAGEPNLCGKVCPRLFLILPSKQGIVAGVTANVQAMWFGAGLVLVVLAVTLFFGRLWCSHLCPVGGFTELVSRVFPRSMKIPFSRIDAPSFRYGYFAVFVAGAYLGIGGIACKLCNFRVVPFLAGAPFEPAYLIYLSSSIGIAGLLTVAVFGFFARGGRAYCNLFCPVGALDSFVHAVSVRFPYARRIRTDKLKCDGCGQCVDSCMVWARSLEKNGERAAVRTDNFSCISCRECEKTCPKGAISYGRIEG